MLARMVPTEGQAKADRPSQSPQPADGEESHSALPTLLWYVPSTQGVQRSELSSDAKEPGGHVVHVANPLPFAKRPRLQRVGLADPPAQELPAGHGSHCGASL
eukprot:3130360-Pleurochrysis_carterae.AAC.6